MPVQFNDGRVLNCRVEQNVGTSAILVDDQGARWKMTPAISADYAGLFGPMLFAGDPIPEWIIRAGA